MADHTKIAVIDGIRTPFLRSGTHYYDLMGWELGRFALKGLIAKTGVDPKVIDHVIFGSVAVDIKTTNIAREILVGAGLPESVPAHTCTMACISANMAITNGASMIAAGHADTVVAGGVETFSDSDIRVSKKYRRFLLDLTLFHRPKRFRDRLNLLKPMRLRDFLIPEQPAVQEFSTGLIMGENADLLAKRFDISRKEQDRYAEMSHQRAAAAIKEKKLSDEIIPVVVPGNKKAVHIDNGPREDTRMEKISRLKGAFDKKYGTVTAANASFLTDGASCLLIMSQARADELGLKPKAFIRSFSYSGRDLVESLLLGPAFSIPIALKKGGLQFNDIGVLEIHEAFASQMLANIKCIESKRFARENLGCSNQIGTVDLDKLNKYGGSLSLGHPFGATGGRLVTTCVNRLQDEGERFGLVSGCAAGGLGNSLILENAG